MPSNNVGQSPEAIAVWAVFISGTGSNLAAILDCAEDARVAVVVSSKASAPGLLRARRAGIPTLVLEKTVDWKELDQKLREYHVNRIFLAGFMKIIPAEFVQKWEGRLLNIHPSWLPSFQGLKSIEKAMAADGPFGVTVHEVTPGVDEGPPVLQRKLAVNRLTDSQRGSLQSVEFLYHVGEHRIVRESISRWKRARTS